MMVWDRLGPCVHPLERVKQISEPLSIESMLPSYKCECGTLLSELQFFHRQHGGESISDLHEKTCYFCGKDIRFVKNHSHSFKKGPFGDKVFDGQCICNHHARVLLLMERWAGNRDILAGLELDLKTYAVRFEGEES